MQSRGWWETTKCGGRRNRKGEEGARARHAAEQRELITQRSNASSSHSRGWRRRTCRAEACGTVMELGQVSAFNLRDQNESKPRVSALSTVVARQDAKSFSRHSSESVSRKIDLPPAPEPARTSISASPPRRLQPPRPAAAPLSPPKRP
jgi:hypothetical protein